MYSFSGSNGKCWYPWGSTLNLYLRNSNRPLEHTPNLQPPLYGLEIQNHICILGYLGYVDPGSVGIFLELYHHVYTIYGLYKVYQGVFREQTPTGYSGPKGGGPPAFPTVGPGGYTPKN